VRKQYDAFWFPPAVRNAVLTSQTAYEQLHFRGGALVADGSEAETVTARWPRLDLAGWQRAIAILRDNQRGIEPAGSRERLPQAIQGMQALWGDRDNPLRREVLASLATCTGHSAGMLDFALGLFELLSVDGLQQAASCRLARGAQTRFVPLEGLPGRIRFYPAARWRRLAARALGSLDGYGRRPWQWAPRPAGLILGFAAGNVPGTGLLLILLGLAAAAGEGQGPPVIVVKNSTREPLFTPLVLSTLEMIDPGLLETTLVSLWDYQDAALQEMLVGQADLVVAAAGDETIEAIGRVVDGVSTQQHPIRYHRHGHKVSFTTIGWACLERGRTEPESGEPLLEVVALLAAVDVALWNQQGCLSSRVHFVEQSTGQGDFSPQEYGRAVTRSLRALERVMPKGVARQRQIHNLFDKYQAMAAVGAVEVLSEYEDRFLVVLHRRPLTAEQFRVVVNDCQERTVAIVPVEDVLEVPGRYLEQVGRQSLQSMSVAMGDPDEVGLDAATLRYAEALGAAGVTGIRTVGRGAFPQLAYSWDGLIPLDLGAVRPAGHFTTLEFDRPWAEIAETYRLVRRTLGAERGEG
jgi:hypothetical protein